MLKSIYVNNDNITLSKIAKSLFHKSYFVDFDNITDETLIFSNGDDFLSFSPSQRKNIIFIHNKFLYRENIVNASITNIHKQDWFKYNLKNNSKILKRTKHDMFNKSMNFHVKLYLDVLEDVKEKIHLKYLYNIVQSTINLYKYAGLIKMNSLSIDKERIYKVLNAVNYNKFSRAEFNTHINNLIKTKFVKRSNKDKIELQSKSKLYEKNTIIHGMTLHRNKNFTVNDYKKVAIEILFASPRCRNTKTALEYTTTLKRIARAVGLKPNTINYHTKQWLKVIKYQFISKEEHFRLLEMKKLDPVGTPYTFVVYTNQKTLWFDKNGEFKNNDEYYLAPIGSRLFTNKKFYSFNRTGDDVFDIDYLSFESKTNPGQSTFVNLAKRFNLVSLMDNVERKRNLDELNNSSFNDSNLNSNAFEIDEDRMIQFVYKDFNTVKGTLRELVAIIGMIKNLSSLDVNLCEFNWNTKHWKLLRKIRAFALYMFKLDCIDFEALKKNIRAFNYIVDRSLSTKGSKLHMKKHKENMRLRKINDENYKTRVTNKFTHEFSKKLTNASLSFLFDKNIEIPLQNVPLVNINGKPISFLYSKEPRNKYSLDCPSCITKKNIIKCNDMMATA